jgi:transposase
MGYNFVGGGDGDQVFLMPPDPRDWLPEGHLAWAVRRQVRELDLAPFLAGYRADGRGNTAYHPDLCRHWPWCATEDASRVASAA